MKTKSPPKSIWIERPHGSRFFEVKASKSIVPCGFTVDSASARGVQVVSLCVNDQEQLKESLNAELFNEVAMRIPMDLPMCPEGKMVDITFTGDVRRFALFYYDSEVQIREGITRRSK